MKDSDDKTRIKKPPQNDAEDKTRIAPPNPSEDDRTRIAPPKPAESAENVPDDDRTRIAPKSSGPASSEDDATRLRPAEASSQDDATRIAPARSRADSTASDRIETTVPDPISSHTLEDTSTPTHSVLKERFVLEKVLGAGGMGVVYKAKDLLKVEANDRDPYVAIKVLGDEFKAHPEAFIALQRESRKSQRIAHPNIVNVYDFDRDGDTVFMTMEYMEGKPLDKLIRQYKSTGLPSEDAMLILEGMCSALMHAHNEKIIHSDFKPGNVFVTDRGTAKVFDFGIARAVAQVEQSEDAAKEDRTVFDAGNLGALTPAYASLEMLEGETPDIRDDIYALGCVAYEMFTGEHPFNKVPADEACKQKLKPKRISGISKNQWQAIEKALAFKREDRVESVDEFLRKFKHKYKPSYQFAVAMGLLLSVGIVVYFLYFNQPPQGPDRNQIRNEIEYQIRLDFHRENITQLMKEASFSIEWEDSLWTEIEGVRKLLAEDDAWLVQTEGDIYQAYLAKITEFIDTKRFTRSRNLIENARRYTKDAAELDKQKGLLAMAEKAEKLRQQRLAQQRQQQIKKEVVQKAQKKKTVELFDVALGNVNQQLKCQGKLNMRNIDTAIDKLRSLDPGRYQKLEPKIVKALAACIQRIGKTFPDRAEESKRYAKRIFKGDRTIAGIVIKPRDPCDASIAGLGARGKRTLCRDKLQQAGSGPSLVVLPGNGSIKMFAMGKYEVTVGELNAFCKNSSTCSEVSGKSELMPATNVPFDVVKAYLKWLSDKSDRKYRLPTKSEWLYAAKARRLSLDPNRNCQLQTRGIQKGGELVKVTTGRQNGWGLVNYVGNAREWVYDRGRKLVAIGGSFETSMDSCNLSSIESHNGTADIYTGFRVLREVEDSKS